MADPLPLHLDPVLATIPGTAAYGHRLGSTLERGDMVPEYPSRRHGVGVGTTDRERRFLLEALGRRGLGLDHPMCGWHRVTGWSNAAVYREVLSGAVCAWNTADDGSLRFVDAFS